MNKSSNEMRKELERKAFHLLFGAFFIIIITLLGIKKSFLIIGTLFILGLIASLLIKKNIKLLFLHAIVERVQRENEKEIPGEAALLFFLSALIVIFFFGENLNIVIASLSVGVFADTGAAIIGKKFGKIKIWDKKTLEGALACFVIAYACLIFVLKVQEKIIVFLGVALMATIIEIIPINDNIGMPLVSGFLLKLLL